METNVIDSSIERIANKLAEYKSAGKTAFISSSFQSHSIPLLHIISGIDRDIPVYFLNTGFHFPETITFRNEINCGERNWEIEGEEELEFVRSQSFTGKHRVTPRFLCGSLCFTVKLCCRTNSTALPCSTSVT